MPRKKTVIEAREPQPTPFPVSEPATESAAPDKGGPSTFTLKVPLRDDGSFDIEGMSLRDATRDKLKALVTDPKFVETVGISSVPGVSAEVFKPEQVEWILDAFSGVECFFFALFFKENFPELMSVAKFDEIQTKAMSEPLAPFLSKIAPLWLRMNPDAAQLAGMLAMASLGSFAKAKQWAAERRKQRETDEHIAEAIPSDQPQNGKTKGIEVVPEI